MVLPPATPPTVKWEQTSECPRHAKSSLQLLTGILKKPSFFWLYLYDLLSVISWLVHRVKAHYSVSEEGRI